MAALQADPPMIQMLLDAGASLDFPDKVRTVYNNFLNKVPTFVPFVVGYDIVDENSSQ